MRHVVGLLGLAYLVCPLGYCLLLSLSDSTLLETPLATGRVSLRWYSEFFADGRWVAALGNSLLTAALTVPLALVCGTTAAIAFERYRFGGRAMLGAVILAPMFVPPVVLGVQSLAFYHRVGLWGTPLSIALAHSLWATPVCFTIMRASFALIDVDIEDAARGLGADPLATFVGITLPLVAPGLVASAFFAFVISVNELVMALFLATPATQTLPTLIWPQVRNNVTPIVAAASGVTILITLAALLLANGLIRARRLVAA